MELVTCLRPAVRLRLHVSACFCTFNCWPASESRTPEILTVPFYVMNCDWIHFVPVPLMSLGVTRNTFMAASSNMLIVGGGCRSGWGWVRCPPTNPSKSEGAQPTEKRWFQAISLMQRVTNCHIGAGVHNFRAPIGCADQILWGGV